jgi:hypothetical protein
MVIREQPSGTGKRMRRRLLGTAVDDGRCPYVEDTRAGEDKDNRDRAQTQAECGSDVSASNATGCDVGRRSEEEKDEIKLHADEIRSYSRASSLSRTTRSWVSETLLIRYSNSPSRSGSCLVTT